MINKLITSFTNSILEDINSIIYGISTWSIILLIQCTVPVQNDKLPDELYMNLKRNQLELNSLNKQIDSLYIELYKIE